MAQQRYFYVISKKFKILLIILFQSFLAENAFARYIQADPIGLPRDYSDPVMQMTIKIGIPLRHRSNSIGLNHPYTYVNSSPILRYDPFGLTQEDINKMLALAKRSQPDLDVPDDAKVKDLGKDIDGNDISGFTNPITKNISLDDRYLEILNCYNVQKLLEVIIHESIHRTRPRMDMILRPITHLDIYKEARSRARKQTEEVKKCGCKE